ncbi:MAG: DUF2304 family protein [Candidatus Magasanikbacteria bacterium]|nr:DUF2304 family protein [Candidatus Magasanikbacteria bacterium]
MTLIQIILLVVFLAGALSSVIRFKRGDIRPSELILWILFWLSAGAVVAWPDATFYFAKIFGIGRGADLIVYLALVLLFFLVFRLIISVEKQRREITILTRLMALKNVDDKKE